MDSNPVTTDAGFIRMFTLIPGGPPFTTFPVDFTSSLQIPTTIDVKKKDFKH
jgi:hypothetical protein